MILNEEIFLKPLDKYLHLERYVNRGSPSGFSFKHTTSKNTCPQCGVCKFSLYGINLNSKIPNSSYGPPSSILSDWDMIIHPDMLNEKVLLPYVIEQDKCLNVAPTSSGRTVRVLDNDNLFLKLNYKGLLGRINRQLTKQHAITSLEVSSLFSRKIDEEKLPEYFYFMRDVSAKVVELPLGDSTYEWGVVEREPLPYPNNSKIKFIIPCFSLFSKDLTNPDDQSLLFQLMIKQSKKIENFLFEDLIAPIFSCYFSSLLNCGLQLDAQAQNTLIGIDENYKIVGIISRDAESVDKDISLIKELSLDISFVSNKYKCLRKGDYNYQILHSFMFDFKLGEYLISPIIEEAASHFCFDVIGLIDRIKDFNSHYIKKLPQSFFPKDWYNYANLVFDRTKPRPYIANKNPKYRANA